MSLIAGPRGIGDWSHPDERPKTYHEAVFKYLPDWGAFFGLLSKLPKETVRDMEFKVFEEGIPTTQLIVSGAHVNTATTITLSTSGSAGTEPAKAVRAGDMLRVVRTGEIMRVTIDPGPPWTSITVATRGSMAETDDKAALVDGDVIEVMGAVCAEGTNAVEAVSDTLSTRYNFCEDVEEPVELSDWALNMEIRPKAESAWAREKRRAAERFKLKMAKKLYFGKRKQTTENGKLLYLTGGLASFVGNNFDHSSSGTSLHGILDIFQTMRSYGQGSEVKLGFAGSGAITRLAKLLDRETQSYFRMGDPIDKRGTWGLTVREFSGPTMTLQIIHDAVLSMNDVDTYKVFIVDPKYVKLAVLAGIGDVKYEDLVMSDGYRGKKGRYRAVSGLMVAQPNLHAVWTVGPYLPS